MEPVTATPIRPKPTFTHPSLSHIPADQVSSLLSIPADSPLLQQRLKALGVQKVGHRLQICLAVKEAQARTAPTPPTTGPSSDTFAGVDDDAATSASPGDAIGSIASTALAAAALEALGNEIDLNADAEDTPSAAEAVVLASPTPRGIRAWCTATQNNENANANAANAFAFGKEGPRTRKSPNSFRGRSGRGSGGRNAAHAP